MTLRTFSVCKTIPHIDLTNFIAVGKKIIGVDLNYMDIVRARGIAVPKAPVLFLKPTTSYVKEGSNIVIPKPIAKIGHAVELAVIINNTCKNICRKAAESYIGGYCLAINLTAMNEMADARQTGDPWTLGMGFDTATPVSPVINPSDIKDLYNLELWLKVDGELRQDGNTKDLIFKIPELIAYASNYMTLERNDLILTGTPDGASSLISGNVIECGLGELANLKFKIVNEEG